MAVLTANTICRAALLTLEQARGTVPTVATWPKNAEPWPGAIKGLFGMFLFIRDEDRLTTLEHFCEGLLIPAIAAWEFSELRGIELGPQMLLIPRSFLDVANVFRDGISMRCLVEENRAVGDRDIPSRVAKYYDVSTDEFKTEPCSMCVSFWVHTPDTAARLADPEDMRKLAKVK